jgi:hypothetical protein
MVLERYPDPIIDHTTSHATGIQRHCKFPPSIAEIVEFCDSEVARRARLEQLGPPIEVRRHERMIKRNRANVYVSPDSPQYPAMVERSMRPDTDPLDWRLDPPGIWVGFNWLEGPSKLPKGMGHLSPEKQRLADEEKLAGYREQAAETPPPETNREP